MIESALERLKIERERLGAADQPARRRGTERSFPKTARDASSRERLRTSSRRSASCAQGIQSLNREGRERLLAAFDVVNGQFQRLFTHLFGGGTAELQLIEIGGSAGGRARKSWPVRRARSRRP